MADTLDLTLDQELLAEARRLGIDVRSALNAELRRRIDKERRTIAWREENRDAMRSWNEYVEKHGLWYEALPRE